MMVVRNEEDSMLFPTRQTRSTRHQQHKSKTSQTSQPLPKTISTRSTTVAFDRHAWPILVPQTTKKTTSEQDNYSYWMPYHPLPSTAPFPRMPCNSTRDCVDGIAGRDVIGKQFQMQPV